MKDYFVSFIKSQNLTSVRTSGLKFAKCFNLGKKRTTCINRGGEITGKGFVLLYFSCYTSENVANAIITYAVIVCLINYIIRKYREGGIKFVQKIKVKAAFFSLL